MARFGRRCHQEICGSGNGRRVFDHRAILCRDYCAGIFDGDILVVNRTILPRHRHIVVAVVDGDFTVKRLYKLGGRVKLQAANPTFPDIAPKDDQLLEVWGVVTATIKQFPR